MSVTKKLVELSIKNNNYLVPENMLVAQIADDESYIETINTTKYDKGLTDENKSVFDSYSEGQLDRILAAPIGRNVEGVNVTEQIKDQIRLYNKGKKDRFGPKYKIYLLKEHFTKEGKLKKGIDTATLPWALPNNSMTGLRGENPPIPHYPPGSLLYVSPTSRVDEYQIEHVSVNTLCQFLADDGDNTNINDIARSGLKIPGFLDGLFRPSTKYRVPESAIAPGGKKIADCSEVIDNFPYSDSDEKQNELDEDLDFETWCSKKGGTSSLSGTSKAIDNIQKKITEFQKSLKEGGDNPLREIYDDITEIQEDYEQKIKDLKEAIKPFIDEITEAIAGLFLKLKTKVIRKSNLFFNLFKTKSPSAGTKNISAWQDILQKAITCIFKLLISNLFNMVMKAIMSFINKIVNTVNCVVENFISQFMGQLIGQLSALLNSIFGPISNLLGKGISLLTSVSQLLADILSIINCEVEICTINDGKTKTTYWNMLNGGKPGGTSINLSDVFKAAEEVGEAWEAVTNVPEDISNYKFDINIGDTFDDVWKKCDPGPLFCGSPKVTFWGSGDGEGNGALGNAVINADGEIIGVDLQSQGQWTAQDYEDYVTGTTETYIDFDDECDNGHGGWGEVIVGPITGIGEVGVGTTGGVTGILTGLYDSSYDFEDVGTGAGLGVGITFRVTVNNTSVGDKFFIDSKQQRTLNLERGNTYILEQQDESNTGHPLRFSETKDNSGKDEYERGVTIDGIPGDIGAYSRLVVNNNTPDTLYYYCKNHPKMGGVINIIGDDEEVVASASGRNATVEISAVNINGGVIAFRNLVGGSGYNECSMNVVTVGGNGTRFTVDIMKTYNTSISALAVNNKGSGYKVGDIVTITSKFAKKLIRPTGYGVQKVLIMESGYGYLPAPDGSQGGSNRTWAGRCQTTVKRANGDWDLPFDKGELITLSLGDCVRLPSKPVVCIDKNFDTSQLPGSTIITDQYVPKDMSSFPLSIGFTDQSEEIITDFSKITLIDEKFKWEKVDSFGIGNDLINLVPTGQYGIERIEGTDPRVRVQKWNEETQSYEHDHENSPLALWYFYADGEFIGRYIQNEVAEVPQFYRDGILYRIGNRQFDFKFPDITSNQMPWLRAADTLPANNWVLTTGWSPFLKNYGVYPSPADPNYSIIGNHTATWKVNTLFPGTYTFEMQADNIGTISWDGVELASTEAFSGHNKFVISDAYAGEEYGMNVHTITANIQNIPHPGRTAADYTSIEQNPGAIAWVLRDPRGVVIKTSLDPFETQFEEISFSKYFAIKMYSVDQLKESIPQEGEWFGCVKDYNKAKLLGFSDCDIRNYLESNPDIQLDQCMKDKLNDPNWGNCSEIAVSLTAPGCPKDPCIADNTYPVIACLDDIYVDAAGFGYDCCNDTVIIEPANGAEAVIEECDGGIQKIRVTRCGAGFTSLPEVRINTFTGYNSVLKPILKFHKPEEVDVPEGTSVLQVIDCVGHVGNSVRTKVNG